MQSEREETCPINVQFKCTPSPLNSIQTKKKQTIKLMSITIISYYVFIKDLGIKTMHLKKKVVFVKIDQWWLCSVT